MSIPKDWQPQWDEQQTRALLKQHEGTAHFLPTKEQEELQRHAEAYGVPYYTGDFSLLRAVGQAASGFVEGFITLDPGVMEPPKNEYEQIARNIGHLAGFAPGIMAGPAKLAGNLLKWQGARNFAAAASAANKWSIPMMSADFATKAAKKAIRYSDKAIIGRSQAMETARNFVLGNAAKHVLEGAFHLGVASAVSSWRGGVDEMIDSAKHGAKFGAVFRMLGNLIPGTATHEKVARAVAGSLFQGLPSTQRGATTPEQVYEYLMGAYFGSKEMSWSRAKGTKFVQKVQKKAKEDPEWAAKSGLDPELHPEFKDLPEAAKPHAKKAALEAFGDPDAIREGYFVQELLTQLGQKGKLKEEQLIEEGFKPTGEYKDGEAIYRMDKDVAKAKFQRWMTSGGAEGADTHWASWASKVGIPAINYTFAEHAGKIKAAGFPRILTTAELEQADAARKKANQTIGNREPDKQYTRNLLRRNFYQVKHANAVYAVGEFLAPDIKYKGKKESVVIRKDSVVKGGTGTTVQMAIDMGKPVYLFEQTRNKWYKWNPKAGAGRLGMFTHIKEPPKPPKRFAGIGTRKINPAGQAAIAKLMQKHFKAIKSVKEDAIVDEKEAQRVEKAKALTEELAKNEAEYAELANQITVEVEQGLDVSQKQSRLGDLAAKSIELTERINRLNISKLGGFISHGETVSEEIADKADTDFEGPTNLEVGKRALQFTQKHLKEVFNGAPTPIETQNLKGVLSQLVQNILMKGVQEGNPAYLRRGKKENLSEEWANEVQQTIRNDYPELSNFKLTPEARLELRQWMTRKNLGKLVTHMQSDGVTIYDMPNPAQPGSRAGNRKVQEEPVKRIEVAFEEVGGKEVDSEGNPMPVYKVLDHVTIRTENGNRDVDLSNYRNQVLLKAHNWNESAAKKAYNDFVGNMMKEMAKKGYYALGGSSDKDRIIWARFNPIVDGMTKADILSDLNSIPRIVKKEIPDFKKHFEQSKREYITKYGMEEGDFNKAWLSNLYYDIHMNGMEVNSTNVKDLLTHPGFIKNSATFNKRQQIWMNNAWEGDIAFIKKYGIKLYNDKYRYLLVRDLSEAIEKAAEKDPEFFHNIERLNSELPENVDGAIIVSDKVLDAINADFGNPKSGQNKSFIVAPNAEKGALLGKYMFHKAGPALSKLMDAEGLHMIMQDSAIKQRGLRELSDYDIVNGELKYDKQSVFNDLSPEHVRGNFGVYGNEHMIQNQRIPKQVLQNLLPTTWAKIDSDVIDNMFDGIIRNRWDGDAALNRKVDKYLEIAAEGELSVENRMRAEKEIINNLDKIGIEKIVEAMQSDQAPGLSEAIYKEILKVEKNEAMEQYLNGDITQEELSDRQSDIAEFNSLSDRIIRVGEAWVNSQRKDGIDANITSLYMHKFIRDFRIKAVQNYLINSVTKPKRDNSASAFMRPYDKAMRQDLDKANPRLKELETNDEIFFLDNEFKNVLIHVNMPESYDYLNKKAQPLETLWALYNNKKITLSKANKDYLEDVFTALTVRTPMDSMSGAQVLKFAGFTGREGHGILLHGRAMRAEGGADLDGDKSSIFFGGKGGFNKAWKDAYRANKEEFYTIDKNEVIKVSDNKNAIIPGTKNTKYRDILAVSPDAEQKAYLQSKASQFSPTERIRISEAAVDGRAQLGPAVVNKQVISAAYAAILQNGGKDEFLVKAGKGKGYDLYKIKIEAKDTDEAREHQRNMGRAQIGLASDPLDELGLTGNKKWFKEMWKSHFDVKEVWKVGRGKKKDKKLKESEIDDAFYGDILEASQIKKGILGSLLDINKAYWGRNWNEGRKYNMNEILNLGDSIIELPENIRDTSFLSKTGQLLQGLDWSDSIYGKINKDYIQKIYSDHKKNLKEYKWMVPFFNRPSFKVEINPYIQNVLDNNLWTHQGINDAAGNTKKFFKSIKNTMFHDWVMSNPGKYFAIDKKGRIISLGGIKEKVNRRNLLNEFKNMSEDFIINDITDLASIHTLSDIMKRIESSKDVVWKDGSKTTKEAVQRIHNEVDRLKKRSWLMSRDRKTIDRWIENVKQLGDPGSRKAVQELIEHVNASYGRVTVKEQVRKIGEDLTSELQQIEIDNAITEFKTNLTPKGEILFDQLMLGSVNRGNMAAISRFEKKIKKHDQFTLEVIKGLRKEASKTRVSRLGFMSNAISDRMIYEHIGAFSELLKEGHRPLPKESLKELDSIIENHKSRIEDDGVDNALIESILPSGYAGVKKGPVDSSTKKVITEIADILKEMHNKDSMDINGLTRGLLKKDLNAMNKNDFIVFRNWLQEMRRGNFIQRMFHGKGPVKLNRRHWLFFPKAVNREIMRDDIILLKKKGYFRDKFGKPHMGTVLHPTHYIDMVQDFIGKMNDSAVNLSDKFIKDFNESMLFYSGLEDAQKFWEIAVRQREAHHKEITRIQQSEKSPEVIKAAIRELIIRRRETEQSHDWKNLQNKSFKVNYKGERIDMTGKQIVKNINKELTRIFKEMHSFIKGKEGALEAYEWQTPKGGIEYNYKKFIRDLQAHQYGFTPKGWAKEGITDVPSYFGIDGLRKIARAMQIDMMPTKELKKEINKHPVSMTGDLGEAYFPHMFFDKAVSKKLMKEAMLKIMNLPDSKMPKKDKLRELTKLFYKNKSLGGEMRFQEMENWDLYDDMLSDIAQKKKVSEEKMDTFNANEQAGSMKSREVHMGGWSIDPVVVESYIRSLSNTYHRQLNQMYGRQMHQDMFLRMRGKWGNKQATAWQNFMKLYIQDAIGNPSVIPEHMIDMKEMKLKGTPYKWWSDNNVRNKINNIARFLGVTDARLPKELQGLSNEDLRHWSNLEAQYQMASLLAHPKSMIYNIFGGTAHTIMSAGASNFRKAKDYKFLSTINPEWTNKQKIDDFVVSQGVLPEFLVYEVGLQKEFQSKKGQGFLKDLSAKFSRNPGMSEKSVIELAQKHGLKDKVVNAAAKFMTIPERALRRDSFMAHYIHIWEKYGGAIKEYDHPFLIEQAKKGVKATQFLYNAPFRPAFARTSLGKIMTRFQLWAWNSVRFRNDVRRRARIYGLEPGTDAYNQFKRTAQIDLFVFALANMYMYSVFENALPAPWNWMQDTADWVLGDENARDRAFFGAWPKEVAPLQMVTPPALRLVGPTFNSMLSDDWSKFSKYYVWTMLPFGRILRDIVGPGNLITTPSRFGEKIFGLPFQQQQRYATEFFKEEPEDDLT
tara:strand:+ start:352 stop:9924 length:9573 start_codon:yes stop_codon:yes gene_type:complete